MADEWEQYVVNAESQGQGDEWAQYALPAAAQTSPDQAPSFDPMDAMLGGAAAAGAAGLGMGAKKLIEPHLQRRPLVQEFEGYRKKLGLPKGQSPDYITDRIRSKVGDVKSEYANKVGEVKMRNSQAVSRLKNNLNEFDQTVLKSSVEQLAGSVKEGYPKFLQNAYNAYEEGLSSAEGVMNQKNIPINGTSFKEKVLDKTISYATSKGYSPEQIAPLQALRESIPNGDVGLTKAKGFITTFDPNGKVPKNLVRIMRENWGSELERVAPKEVQASLKALNAQYKPFAEVRGALEKIIDPQTGQADTAKLYKYINTYAKTQQETGISRVMDILKKDIPSVGKQFENLKNVKTRRQARVDAPLKAQVNQTQRLQKLFAEAQEKLKSAQSWATKAEEANDRLNVLNKTVSKQGNAAGRVIRAGAGGAGLRRLFSAAPLLGPASDIMGAVSNSEELKGMPPEQIFKEWLSQQNMPMGGEI